MTLKEIIDESLGVSTATQKDIQTINDLSKKLPKEDQEKILAVTNNLQKGNEPVGGINKPAETPSTTETAEVNKEKETAQIPQN